MDINMKSIGLLALCILVCLGAGFLGSTSMDAASFAWYDTLIKAPINPPKWLFAPVWIFLYILMGVALWIVLHNRSDSKFFRYGLYAFGIQLILNTLWTKIFFGLRAPLIGFIEIIMLDIFVVATLVLFLKIKRQAGFALIPYALWLCVATYLNWYTMHYN